MAVALLVLQGAAAPRPQAAVPARPPEARVSYLIGRNDVEELRRVVGDQVAQRHRLGLSTVFGVEDDRLATIAQRDEGGRGVQHLTIFDLKTGSIVSERNVEPRLLTWMSGPERVVLPRPREEAVYFVTLEVEGDSVHSALARLDLKKGAVTKFRIPDEVSNARPFDVGDMVGVYSWNHGAIAVLKDGGLKVIAPAGGTARSVVAPAVVSSVLGLPGVGVVRVALSGKAEVFDPGKAAPSPPRALTFDTPVAEPQAATFEGKPVLVYGEAQRGAMRKTVISSLVIYDPVAGKPLWKKKLPWLARTFTVSPDASLFRLIPLTALQLTYYDRKSDSFTKSVSFRPREVENVVIVPSG